MARASDFDSIVLDVMLPGMDGFETCRRLRGAGVWAGVLMLTAGGASRTASPVSNCGADDYLTKPFSFSELLARLRALARRGRAERPGAAGRRLARLDPGPVACGAATRRST